MVTLSNDKREIERQKAEIERLNSIIHSLNEKVWENNFKQQFFSYYASILENVDQSSNEFKPDLNAEKETNKINELQEQISNLCHREANLLNENDKLRCLMQQQDLERSSAVEHVELLEKELISFETTVQETQKLKSEVESKLQQKQQEVDDLKTQILNSSSDFQQQISNLYIKCKTLEVANESLQSELLSQKENFSRVQEEILSIQNQSRIELQSKEEETKQIIDGIINERESLVIQNHQLQEQFSIYKEDSCKTISELKAQVSNLSEDAERSQQQFEQLAFTITTKNKEMESQNEKLMYLQEYSSSLEVKLEQAHQVRDDSLRSLNEKELQIEDKIKSITELYSKNEVLQNMLTDIQNKNAVASDEIAQLNKQIQQKELDHKNEIISIQSTVVKLSTEMTSRLEQISNLSARHVNDELKKELLDKIDILKKETEMQRVVIDKLNGEEKVLHERIAELQEVCDNNVDLLRTKASEFSTLKNQCDELVILNTKLSEERNVLEQILKARENELHDLHSEIETSRSNMSISIEEENSLKATNTSLNETISKLNSDLRTIKSSLKEKIVELEKSTELKESLIQENKKLNSHYLNLKKLEQENSKLQTEKDNLKEELSQIKVQFEEVQSQLSNKDSSHENSGDIKNLKYQLELLREEQKINKSDISKKDIEILNLKTIIEKYKSNGTNSGNNIKETKLEAPKQEPTASKSNGKKKEKTAQPPSSQDTSQVEFSQPASRNSKNKRKLDKVETVEKENIIDNQPTSPPKKQKTDKKFVISFSNRSAEEKARFKEIITQLGGTVIEDTGKYDSRTTHLLTVIGSSTIKTIGASLSCKWIIRKPEEWLEESKKQGHFVDESPYGKRNTESPLKNKKICLLTATHKTSQAKSAVEIIKEFGSCSFIPSDNAEEADIVVLWDEEKPSNLAKETTCINWDNFLKLVHNDC